MQYIAIFCILKRAKPSINHSKYILHLASSSSQTFSLERLKAEKCTRHEEVDMAFIRSRSRWNEAFLFFFFISSTDCFFLIR